MADHVRHAFWVACGSLVLLGIFFAALGAFDPTEAVGLTVALLVLAALWLAHEWGGMWRDEHHAR
jgi:hypothetical protein